MPSVPRSRPGRENLQARGLSQRRHGFDNIIDFHNSMIIEILKSRQEKKFTGFPVRDL